jgi:predicted DNA-binding transcriptional regulator YafY
MLETSTRLLQLLALLQVRSDWTGSRLAERLGVSTRTIRNDIDRLRRLGYPVQAAPGVAGGYRLGAGTSLPPLLLDDDEAVAVAIGLRAATGGNVTGIEEASLRALAKLEQVLPSRLRHRVGALHSSTLSLGGEGPTIDPNTLTTIAAAVRARERLRFDYPSRDGGGELRTVEPQRLVHTRGRWYLVGWDPGRDDWRTFRADRIGPLSHTGPRFPAREDPEGDIGLYVEKALGSAMWEYRARVRVRAPAARVSARVPPAVLVEAIDGETCFVNVGSDSAHQLALWVGLIDEDFEVEVDDSPELAAELRALADRYLRAAEPTSQPQH